MQSGVLTHIGRGKYNYAGVRGIREIRCGPLAQLGRADDS